MTGKVKGLIGNLSVWGLIGKTQIKPAHFKQVVKRTLSAGFHDFNVEAFRNKITNLLHCEFKGSLCCVYWNCW